MMSSTSKRTYYIIIFSLVMVIIILAGIIFFSHGGNIFPNVSERIEYVPPDFIDPPDGGKLLEISEAERIVIEKIYNITTTFQNFDEPKDLKNIRVPSGSHMVYKMYQWISELPGETLSSELKIAIADILWFFQVRDINDPYLGDCNIASKGDDWHTNSWAGYYQHFVPVIGCDTVYRAGLMGDGGKHLCNVHRIMKENLETKKGCMLFSFGTFNDISFDNQMFSLLGCKSHAFDPTIKEWQLKSQINEHVEFHQYGIGPSYNEVYELEGKPLKTLRQISEDLKISKVDILKVDIEGNEIPVFDHIFDKEGGILVELKVKIILIEYHHPSALDKKLKEDCHDRKKHLYPFLKKFYDHGFLMYRFEHNVYDVKCIEYGFISKDIV